MGKIEERKEVEADRDGKGERRNGKIDGKVNDNLMHN